MFAPTLAEQTERYQQYYPTVFQSIKGVVEDLQKLQQGVAPSWLATTEKYLANTIPAIGLAALRD